MRIEREQFDEAEDRISLPDRHLGPARVRRIHHGRDDPADRPGRHPGAGRRRPTSRTSPPQPPSSSSMTDIWKQFDTRFFLPYYLMAAGALHAGAGDKRTARACLEDSLGLAAETGMRFWQSETQRHLALLELHPGGKRGGPPRQRSCWPGPSTASLVRAAGRPGPRRSRPTARRPRSTVRSVTSAAMPLTRRWPRPKRSSAPWRERRGRQRSPSSVGAWPGWRLPGG